MRHMATSSLLVSVATSGDTPIADALSRHRLESAEVATPADTPIAASFFLVLSVLGLCGKGR